MNQEERERTLRLTVLAAVATISALTFTGIIIGSEIRNRFWPGNELDPNCVVSNPYIWEDNDGRAWYSADPISEERITVTNCLRSPRELIVLDPNFKR